MKNTLKALLLLCTFGCLGQKTLDLSQANVEVLIAYPYAEILTDTHEVETAHTILKTHKPFHKFASNTVSKEEINSYWIRFRLLSDIERHWFLELPDPHIKEVVVYKLEGDSLVPTQTRAGYGLPFAQKTYFYKNFLCDLNTTVEHPTTYYVHLQTKLVNSFSLKALPAQKLIKYSLTEYYLLGAYYGLLLMMALYNFAIYLRVKEKVYLFYVLYVLCCALNSFSEDGLGFQFIWSNMPYFNFFLMYWVSDLLLFSFLFYSISFLNLYEDYKNTTRITIGIACLHLTLNAINHGYFHSKLVLSQIYLMPFAIVYILGIYKILKGDKSSRYFIGGYSFILLSLIIFYLRSLGITVIHHLVTIYSFNIGFLIEVVVLSYALGERLRTEKSDKEQAQQKTITQLKENEKIRAEYTLQLEMEVSERTKELELANEEIQRFNAFLEAKNIKLETDVKNISKARVTSKLISLEEFKDIYDHENTCKEFLFNRKWKSKPYKCSKCGHEKDIPHEDHSKRCAKCKYVESATANTIFHGVKIPLPEAFYILYVVFNNKVITAEELSKNTGVSERSCSVFKKKIQDTEKTLKPKNKKTGWEYLIDMP